MSKLSKQDKIDIYNNWKYYHKSLSHLGREYGVRPDNLYYLIRLIDLHGLEILNKSYSSYSVEFKKTAIKRILINDEPATQVSLDLGLLSLGMIFNWLRKYKEDEDNVINHKKGRPSHEKQVKDLKRQTLKLTVENEFVKKLSAFVSQRENQKHQ